MMFTKNLKYNLTFVENYFIQILFEITLNNLSDKEKPV